MDEKVIKALGDPKRYGLLRMMSESGYCVGALASRSGLSESAVSQHLKILREAGLVYGEKYGYYTHYSVDKDALRSIIAELDEMLNMRRSPCDGPFYGCPESKYVRCKAYVPPENRNKEKEEEPRC